MHRATTTTPNVSTGVGARRSLLPRASSAMTRGGSTGKKTTGVTSGGRSRRSSTENAPTRHLVVPRMSSVGGPGHRQSVAGGSGTLPRQSLAGASALPRQSLAGAGALPRQSLATGACSTSRSRGAAIGVSRLSTMSGAPNLGRTTPVRSALTPSNFLAPPSSHRLSTESRASTVGGRRKREDSRPITEPAFKKECVDNVFGFLYSYGFNDEASNINLNRRMITNPTTKDFTCMFSFIYSKLEPGYKLPTRFDEEIIRLLKLLHYPAQFPKSTFTTVGSMHSWPTLLAMLSWLCSIVNDIITTIPQEIAFPSDFEGSCNQNWQNLNLIVEAFVYREKDQQEEYLQSRLQTCIAESGVTDADLQQVEEEVQTLNKEIQDLEQDANKRKNFRTTIHQLSIDIAKLAEYNAKLRTKLQQMAEEPVQLKQSLEKLNLKRQELEDKKQSLEALRRSQSFTTSELFTIKTHEKTTQAAEQQIATHQRQTQEKVWDVERLQCRAQQTLSERIQKYNCSDAANVVGAISCAGNEGMSAGGLAAKLEVQQLLQLTTGLRGAVRDVHSRLVQEHINRNTIKQECRRIEEQTEDRKQQVSKSKMQTVNLEEDHKFTKQQIQTEETAFLEQLVHYQNEASVLRKEHLDRAGLLYSNKNDCDRLQEQVEQQQKTLDRSTEQASRYIRAICEKVREQLAVEEQMANELAFAGRIYDLEGS